MITQDQTTLRAEYPEIPAWILTREGMTLTEARKLMELRRRAFPKTAPAKCTDGGNHFWKVSKRECAICGAPMPK